MHKKYALINRAVIEIEAKCNYNCTLCPQPISEPFNKSINFKEFKRIVNELKILGVEAVQLEGSGEATLNKDLPKYIKYLTENNIRSHVYSNGFLMKGDFMKECVDNGLSLFRFSINGYDRKTYKERMMIDNFDNVTNNLKAMIEYSKNKETMISTYHLSRNAFETKQYLNNIIDKFNTYSEIWKAHNWGGKFDTKRKGIKKSCGRPFAPEITIRAGGIYGHNLAVMPCCQTPGNADAVLGHCDDTSIIDVFNSEKYNWLREKHQKEEFDEISFCKNCDFLYDNPDVLLWSNYAEIKKMNGVSFYL